MTHEPTSGKREGTDRLETPDQQKAILAEVKRLAQEYYAVTGGRVLGVTGEVAEYEASQRLGLVLAPPGNPGYDASRDDELIQIKGRRVPTGRLSSQRLGDLDLGKRWHTVLVVLLDERFEPTAIYEASRSAIERSLHRLEREAREQGRPRQGMAVTEFIALGRQVWPSGI